MVKSKFRSIYYKYLFLSLIFLYLHFPVYMSVIFNTMNQYSSVNFINDTYDLLLGCGRGLPVGEPFMSHICSSSLDPCSSYIRVYFAFIVSKNI